MKIKDVFLFFILPMIISMSLLSLNAYLWYNKHYLLGSIFVICSLTAVSYLLGKK